jgi:hypothetical protein
LKAVTVSPISDFFVVFTSPRFLLVAVCAAPILSPFPPVLQPISSSRDSRADQSVYGAHERLFLPPQVNGTFDPNKAHH